MGGQCPTNYRYIHVAELNSREMVVESRTGLAQRLFLVDYCDAETFQYFIHNNKQVRVSRLLAGLWLANVVFTDRNARIESSIGII